MIVRDGDIGVSAARVGFRESMLTPAIATLDSIEHEMIRKRRRAYNESGGGVMRRQLQRIELWWETESVDRALYDLGCNQGGDCTDI